MLVASLIIQRYIPIKLWQPNDISIVHQWVHYPRASKHLYISMGTALCCILHLYLLQTCCLSITSVKAITQNLLLPPFRTIRLLKTLLIYKGNESVWHIKPSSKSINQYWYFDPRCSLQPRRATLLFGFTDLKLGIITVAVRC